MQRTTDLSRSISESHARQTHPYDATPTRSKEVTTTSSFPEKKKARGVQLSPSLSASFLSRRPPLPKKMKSSSVYPTWNNRCETCETVFVEIRTFKMSKKPLFERRILRREEEKEEEDSSFYPGT